MPAIQRSPVFTAQVVFTYTFDRLARVAGITQGPHGIYFDGEGFVYTMFDEPVNPEAPENVGGSSWAVLELLAQDHYATFTAVFPEGK